MRIKVIPLFSALALSIVAAAVCYRYAPTSAPPTTNAVRGGEVASSPAAGVAAPVRRTQIGTRPQDGLRPAQDSRADLSASDHADYVWERKAQLIDLTTSGDPAALRAILSELNNQDPEIRKAALSAAVEVGNQEAIPALKNQLAWAEDPQEKVDIQSAIDFLQLPPADQIKNEAMAAQATAENN
jgi:hypothetical protein